jgi:hypothetical protein
MEAPCPIHFAGFIAKMHIKLAQASLPKGRTGMVL